ncbi:MAG: agmatine deiminase family protein [Candidatus Peribacteraceae bacterium]|nr:agmatine deiminase family protein [Candidatus Peribacteraceae bacterium]
MNKTGLTPAQRGFRMPAEWEPHEGTWLSWPYNLGTWDGHLEGAEQAFADIISVLTRHESVHLLVPNAEVRLHAEAKLRERNVHATNLSFHEIESGDVWIRDYGPIFVKDARGKVAYTKWGYNAYGKPDEYADLLIGNDVPGKMPLDGFERFDTGLILEGGSIDVNGAGTLLTTESCLLSLTRNPHLDKTGIEKALGDYLGIKKVLWLSEGIAGDDTTGHVDDITRFVGETTVVTAIEEDPRDPNHKPLAENRKRLETMTDALGRSLDVIALPMPQPFDVEGRRMAATNLNFFVANGVVLVPIYDDPSDEKAIEALGKCFPDREIVGIDCRKLIWGFGSIHCATQQQPL